MEKSIEKSIKMFKKLGYRYESHGDKGLIQFGRIEFSHTKKQIVFRLDARYWFCSYFKNVFNEGGILKEQRTLTPLYTLDESMAIIQVMKDLGWLNE